MSQPIPELDPEDTRHVFQVDSEYGHHTMEYVLLDPEDAANWYHGFAVDVSAE